MTRWQPSICPVCHRVLVHVAGAAIVLCPSCHSILPLHPHPTALGQTACQNCLNLIHHPLGQSLLSCHLCAATTPAPVMYYVCRGCSLYLSYSSSLSAVVCPICYCVEPPQHPSPIHPPSLLPLVQGAPPRPLPILPPRGIPWLPSTPLRRRNILRSPSLPRPHLPSNAATSLPLSSPATPSSPELPYKSPQSK